MHCPPPRSGTLLRRAAPSADAGHVGWCARATDRGALPPGAFGRASGARSCEQAGPNEQAGWEAVATAHGRGRPLLLRKPVSRPAQETRNPKPVHRNQKPETQQPQPEIRNPKP